MVGSTLEQRSAELFDNVTNHNAVLAYMKKAGGMKSVDGGRSIYENLIFAENGNGAFYSGLEELGTAGADVLSGAEYAWKQYAVAVVISGLELRQNSGKAQVYDLLEARIQAAEATMENDISVGIYSDGTGSGGKTITGLDAAVPADPTTGTYGGITRSAAGSTFWRSQLVDNTTTSSTIQQYMNSLWALTIRGTDATNLILAGSTQWAQYMASLQLIQRIADPAKANLGFPTVEFMGAPVVLDTVSGLTATDMYFLNTKYLKFKSHKDCNMVPLGGKREPVNQDASITILGWQGNLTCSNSARQGRLVGA